MLAQNLEEKFLQQVYHIFVGNMPKKIAVAVSGGADSMAMALLCKYITNKHKLSLTALIVDHNLRKNSKKEALQTARWLDSYGIKNTIITLPPKLDKSGLQEWARKQRYEKMADFCHSKGIKYLFTAHHMEDQAETVLLRLMRGSGVYGLSAMQPRTYLFGVEVIRPLLAMTKEELICYLKHNQQEWIEDPSNQNLDFLRVNVRNFLNNAKDRALLIKRLCDTAKRMNMCRDFIEATLLKVLKESVHIDKAGFCLVSYDKFKALHQMLALKLIEEVILIVTADTWKKQRAEEITRLHEAIIQSNFKGATLGGCQIKIKGEHILFLREPSKIAADITITDTSHVIFDKRFFCTLQKNKGINDNFTKAYKIGKLGKDGVKQLKNSGVNIKYFDYAVLTTLPCLKKLEKPVAVPHINYYENISLETNFQCKFINYQYTYLKQNNI